MTQVEATNAPLTVSVVGLGLLGRGIATCFLGYGFRVVGCDPSAVARETTRSYIERGLSDLVEHAGFSREKLSDWKERYQETRGFDDWPACDFVVESVFEELAAKHAVFDKIERVVGSAVAIGSNTSAIPITALQEGRRNPERFLGMHWFEPAHATRFLELIPGEHTSTEAMNAAAAIAERCGKEPSVLAKDVPGFIVNRLAYALYREALHLIEMGVADAETIDRSFRNVCGVWSSILGPFQWIDLTGGPVLYGACMERVLPSLSNATTLPEPLRRLAKEGARGVSNGEGFYRYGPNDAQRAMEAFHAHAWKMQQLMKEYLPLQEGQHAAID
jgi:3-hydroxybutyryl-CoA dehydrogenase